MNFKGFGWFVEIPYFNSGVLVRIIINTYFIHSLIDFIKFKQRCNSSPTVFTGRPSEELFIQLC